MRQQPQDVHDPRFVAYSNDKTKCAAANIENHTIAHDAGLTMGQFGTTRNMIDRNIGTILMVTPTTATAEAIQMELNFEKSKLFMPPDAPPIAETRQGEKIPAVATSQLTIQTMLRVPNGKTAAVAGNSSDGRNHILLVSAKVR